MIPIYFAAAIMITLGIIANFVGNYFFSYLVTMLETRHPSYYSGGGPDFMVAYAYYLPVILIVAGVLLMVLVESQKPKYAGRFR